LTRLLHPDVAAWLLRDLGEPTPAQEACVPLILERRSVLLSSPTGTGKTLAGFLGVIDRLYREHVAGTLAPLGIRAVYAERVRAFEARFGARAARGDDGDDDDDDDDDDDARYLGRLDAGLLTVQLATAVLAYLVVSGDPAIDSLVLVLQTVPSSRASKVFW
jgi:hypothetical protein